MLSPDQKGSIAEAAIVLEAIKLGIGVYKPLTDGDRYDLIFDVRHDLVRVQCKWAAFERDVIVIRCYSSRRCRDGFRKRGYTSDEVDAIAAYCEHTDRCYFLPMRVLAGRITINLRSSPTQNNQRLGVNWAGDFEFAATLGGAGAVAQLGERLTGSQKVTGSSPVGSITEGRVHLLPRG